MPKAFVAGWRRRSVPGVGRSAPAGVSLSVADDCQNARLDTDDVVMPPKARTSPSVLGTTSRVLTGKVVLVPPGIGSVKVDIPAIRVKTGHCESSIDMVADRRGTRLSGPGVYGRIVQRDSGHVPELFIGTAGYQQRSVGQQCRRMSPAQGRPRRRPLPNATSLTYWYAPLVAAPL